MSDIAAVPVAVGVEAAAAAAPAATASGTPASSVKGKRSTIAPRKRELAALQDSLSAAPAASKRLRRSAAASAAADHSPAEASLSPVNSPSDSSTAAAPIPVAGAGTRQAASATRSSKRVIARSSESGDEHAAARSPEVARAGEQTVQQQDEILNVVPLTGTIDRPPPKIGKIKLRVAQTASPAASAPGANASPSDAQAQPDNGSKAAARPSKEPALATPVALGESATASDGLRNAELSASAEAGSEPLPPPTAPNVPDSQGQANHPAEVDPAQSATGGTEAVFGPPAPSTTVQPSDAPAETAAHPEQRTRAMATKRKGPRVTGESVSKRVALARKLASSSSGSEDASGASSSSKARPQAGKAKQLAQQPQPTEANQPASTKKSSSLTYVGATSSGPTDPTHNVTKLPTGAPGAGSGTPAAPGAGAVASAKKGSASGTGKAAVPMPFKKKLGPRTAGTPARTAGGNAPTAAQSSSAAAAGPSFLDSLFAGTIAQTDHEKQLAQEREEKARAAKETREREALERRKQLMARSSRLGHEQALRRESGAGNSGSGTEGEGGSDKKTGKAGIKVSPASRHYLCSLSHRRR